MKQITLTRQDAIDLKRAYLIAKERNQEVFIWRGNEFVLQYAKYLILYLESQMGYLPTD